MQNGGVDVDVPRVRSLLTRDWRILLSPPWLFSSPICQRGLIYAEINQIKVERTRNLLTKGYCVICIR